MNFRLPFWLIFPIWLPATLATLTSTFIFYAYINNLTTKTQFNLALAQESYSYHIYASYPKVLSATETNVTAEDNTAILVRQYLAKYRSPMIDAYQSLVNIARKYEIDPLLLVAIAQCESNLGKKMPPDCYNPFGWGIHKGGTLCFSSWDEGFEKVALGLRQNYIEKGLETPEEIMYKYNYASATERNGSWSKCVNQFLIELRYLEKYNL